MSAVAKFFLAQKIQVSGSDLAGSFITRDLADRGATIFLGQQKDNVPTDANLVIYSDAVPADNPERAWAGELKINQLSYFKFLGVISQMKSKTIAVSGNKGKTTTTAMLSTILENAGLDPMAVVGSFVNSWKSNFRAGNSSYFVVEADEWREHMNELSPWAVILTNIEPDHLDYFGTFEKEIAAFQKYVNKLPGHGVFFYNADDAVVSGLKKPACKSVSFGMNGQVDLRLHGRRLESGCQVFQLKYRGQELGDFRLPMPGLFNIYNAMAATAVALELGVPVQIIKDVLASFQGTWRRFQIMGEHEGVTVVSDYAHHPTAVAATIKAAKEFYPGRRVVAAFQPHHHHRTESLFAEFVKCFDDADCVLLQEIYAVAGRDKLTNEEVSSLDLLTAIRQNDKERNVSRQLEFSKDQGSLKQAIGRHLKKGDVLLVMGAGDIDKVAEDLIA